MKLRPSYLEEHLLPLIESIEPKTTSSFVLEACGLGEVRSHPSVWISFGNKIEEFWNTVISDSNTAENLIEEDNMLIVGSHERQLDHLFKVKELTYYLECKCNLDFDSEKIKASNQKINDISDTLAVAVESGYFCPVKADIPKSILKKYNNKGVNVYGVNDILNVVDAQFTCQEYFTFLRNRVGPVLQKKLGVL